MSGLEKTIVCIDENGRIIDVLTDDFKVFASSKADTVLNVLDDGSRTKFLAFLVDLKESEVQVNWDMNFKVDDKIIEFLVSGIMLKNECIYLIILTRIVAELKKLYEDLSTINNEQINQFRRIIKEYAEKQNKIYLELIEEISKLNNELTNTQRELMKKTLELEELNKRLSELATKDALTGLYNRRVFNEIIEKEISRTRRFNQELTIIYMDINNFKIVNDTKGHSEGDKLLIEFGKILLSSTRYNVDYAFRFGGDEFLLLLVGSNEEDAVKVAERIQREVSKISDIVSVAYGIREIDISQEVNIDELLREADKLMYEHKRKMKAKQV
ncbi:diguanylate cyclase [Fervidobacterium riparium]|uniref:GGDEF domain-containing protein n=1 Tax=Fervidobacterium gondwanense TaxID=44754 RepID=UPI00394F273E